MTFTLDTSGVVPFDGGTLGLISWEGVGQRGGPFAQGYIEALFASIVSGETRLHGDLSKIPDVWAFDHLARETLARIIEDCAAYCQINPQPKNADHAKVDGQQLWISHQRGDYASPRSASLSAAGKVVFL